MYIEPKQCGKISKEVRDWSTGGTKNVYLRCKKPKDCSVCGSISANSYIKPIKEAGEVHTYQINDNDWNATRQYLHREKFKGYAKFPIDENHFILVVKEIIDKDFAVSVDIDDWEKVVLATHYIEGKRRSATGIFSKSISDEELQGDFVVTWPEPIFRDRQLNTVPVSLLPSVINDFLQYFSPLEELNRSNVDQYLEERSRLKAALILLFYDDYTLMGFNEISKPMTDKNLEEWSFIPMSDPTKAKLANNPIAEQAIKMIYSREIPAYEDVSRNIPTWTDYQDPEEAEFMRLVNEACNV